MALGCLSLWKCVMASTAEELASVVILYTKFFTVCNLYWKFGMWRTVFYIFGWIAISTLFPQPWYQGPTKIIELTESAFRQRVLKPSKKSSAKNTMPIEDIEGPRITEVHSDSAEESSASSASVKYWVVMLYANWSVSCLNFEGILAHLSLQYTRDHMKFGKVDVDLYPDIAQEFGISRDPASFDLPTLVLFQNGTEIRRLPELTIKKENNGQTASKADAAKDTITRLGWSKKAGTVIRSFQLDNLAADRR
ncbi:uncharacterized protein BYT42DRAFT_578787 [Radiomyces spectabilis]|uniref:uncharacterized protein n=1 Tax=Radiomyces spectabilis TaxID=64574 RepID=UPI00221F5713|nr:uncharacterized protein BYT42DRAFT_578787 [Radiomyces spectabilis]KAI8372987.1 hypothetical protein BYT42DRAFT_578787 [Radiomyces spectabilis]